MLPDKLFKLGTTSFIFPDHIIPNVKKLGPFFDEIELLVFESRPLEVLPLKNDIKELFVLSRELDVTYNVHLPVDISLTHSTLEKRQKACDTLLKVMDLFLPLNPTTCTLHLELPPDIKSDLKKSLNSGIETDNKIQKKLKKWEADTRQNLGVFLSELPRPDIISIETLDVPFCFLNTFVDDFNLSVCIDAGHQIKYGHDLVETFVKYNTRTPLIHLHGVDFSHQNIKDHTALDKLPEKYLKQIQAVLEKFTGVVSLEVFNLENLNRSLAVLSNMFNRVAPSINAIVPEKRR